MKIYAFADESSASVEGQIDALKRNKLDGLEIRNVDGTNVSEITIDKAKEVKNRLIEIIPYLIDNYFIDLTYNYSVLFKNNITLEDINNWNKIIALFGQKN